MIACMYFIAHLIHCKAKKPLTLAALLQSKTNPTTKCHCTPYYYTLEDCDKNPSGSSARDRKHKYGLP